MGYDINKLGDYEVTKKNTYTADAKADLPIIDVPRGSIGIVVTATGSEYYTFSKVANDWVDL